MGVNFRQKEPEIATPLSGTLARNDTIESVCAKLTPMAFSLPVTQQSPNRFQSHAQHLFNLISILTSDKLIYNLNAI